MQHERYAVHAAFTRPDKKRSKTSANKDNRPAGMPCGPVDDFVDDWLKTLCTASGTPCAKPVDQAVIIL
jgi:hypothetical protein